MSNPFPRTGMLSLAFVAALLPLAAVYPNPAGVFEASDPAVRCDVEAGGHSQATYEGWVELLDIPSTLGQEAFYERASPLVARTFALDVIAGRIYGDRWGRLDADSQEEFLAALGRRIAKELRTSLAEVDQEPELIESTESAGGFEVRYSVAKGQQEEPVSLHLEASTGGECRIVNVMTGNRGVLSGVNDWVKDLREDYSFPYMVAELGDYDFVVLEDFESTPEGALPLHWEWKDKDNESNKPYRVQVESGNQYLEATDEGESVIMGKNLKWNLDKYPFISFRVRVWQIPEGADESDDRAVDSAAGLYFTYKKKFFGKIPESAKYVWSSTLPVGSAVRREGIGRPWQIVFGSGDEGIGEWRTYVFDLRQAYRDTFDGDPPSKPIGVGVLSDANSMKAKAYADYDDIRALRSAPDGVTSGVFEILQPKSKIEG